MGRPIWKGSISFGLVNVPITLYSLEKRSELHFRLLDRRDKAGIGYRKVNQATGQEVASEDIVKGYEYTDDQYVILTDEDLQSVELPSVKTIEIADFVERAEIDDIYFDKPYVVVPAKNAEKGYVLLREVLSRSGRVGVAKLVIRTREYLSAVMPKGEALVVMTLRFQDELKTLEDFNVPSQDLERYRISDREVDLASQLVDAMARTWDPAAYHDEYRAALQSYIEERVAQEGLTPAAADLETPRAEPASNVLDLAALLRESVKGVAKKKSG